MNRIPGPGIHDKFHWFLVPEQWDCFFNLASYKIIKYIFFRESLQNKPLLALTSSPGDAMSNRRDVNHLVLCWKELIYHWSFSGIYRAHLNPSRVLLTLLLCHVCETRRLRCAVQCHVWGMSGMLTVLHQGCTVRAQLGEKCSSSGSCWLTPHSCSGTGTGVPLQQGGIVLENNNQLQLSSIKGTILASDIHLVSNRANWVDNQVLTQWHSQQWHLLVFWAG